MKKMMIKTLINALWVFSLLIMLLYFTDMLSKAGWIWIAVYVICLIIFRPIKPFFKSLRSTDSDLGAVTRIKNKRYIIVMLAGKFITAASMLGTAATGVVLSNTLLLLYFGGKKSVLPIHKGIAILALLTACLQLGINISVLLSQRPLSKRKKIIILAAAVLAAAAAGVSKGAAACVELIMSLFMIIAGHFLVKFLAPK